MNFYVGGQWKTLFTAIFANQAAPWGSANGITSNAWKIAKAGTNAKPPTTKAKTNKPATGVTML